MLNNVISLRYALFADLDNHENSLNDSKLTVFLLFDKIIIKLLLEITNVQSAEKTFEAVRF